MAKITTNVRFKIIAPDSFKKTKGELDDIIKGYFMHRGKFRTVETGDKYELTSYKFANTEATIRFKIHYDYIGNVRSFDMLGTFDCFRKYITDNLTVYKDMIEGFVKYLKTIKNHWYVDVFVFRCLPIDFKRQFLSRVGENVQNAYINITTDKGYLTIKSDRLEYRVQEWDEETIKTINNIFRRYTRK